MCELLAGLKGCAVAEELGGMYYVVVRPGGLSKVHAGVDTRMRKSILRLGIA